MALTTTEMVDERPTALSPQTFFSNVDGDHDHDDYATSLPLPVSSSHGLKRPRNVER